MDVEKQQQHYAPPAYQKEAPPAPGWAPQVQPPPPGVQGAAYHVPADPAVQMQPAHAVAFNDRIIRRGFREVFGLLTIMLFVVAGITAVFRFVPVLRDFVRENIAVCLVSYGLFLITYLALLCFETLRRNFPYNLKFPLQPMMVLLTLSIGYMTATISAFHDTDIVFLAFGICTVVCLTIILFSMQTKIDFTRWIGVVFVVLMCLCLWGIAVIFCTWIAAGLMALVFMIFLANDVEMVMGGKKYEIGNMEKYIDAACFIYICKIYNVLF